MGMFCNQFSGATLKAAPAQLTGLPTLKPSWHQLMSHKSQVLT